MAWVDTQPWLVYTVKDGTESVTTLRFHLDKGLSVAAAMAAADSLRTLLEPLLDVTFIRQAVTFGVTNLDPATPGSGSNVKKEGAFIFRGDTDQTYGILAIPGYSGAVDESGNFEDIRIDLTDADVAAFVSHIITGLFCNAWGHDFQEIRVAFIRYPK